MGFFGCALLIRPLLRYFKCIRCRRCVANAGDLVDSGYLHSAARLAELRRRVTRAGSAAGSLGVGRQRSDAADPHDDIFRARSVCGGSPRLKIRRQLHGRVAK
jgi:hypothetical protein